MEKIKSKVVKLSNNDEDKARLLGNLFWRFFLYFFNEEKFSYITSFQLKFVHFYSLESTFDLWFDYFIIGTTKFNSQKV